ncbi:leucyl aminopeptidase [bacterium]|nr:leucyl aminopeptidase [bacterium]
MVFPKIELTSGEGRCDALALGFFQAESKAKGKNDKDAKSEPPLYLGKKGTEIASLTERLAGSKHFSAKKSETDLLRFVEAGGCTSTLLVGLGQKSKLDSETLRRVGASVYQAQKRAKLTKVAVQGDSFFSTEVFAAEATALQAFAEGYLLASYEFNDFKEPSKEAPKHLEIRGSKVASSKEAIAKAEAVAAGVCFARELGDLPPNKLTPAYFAELVSGMAKRQKVKCTIWNRAQIEKEKMGLFMGVAKGSELEPRFMILEYRGGKKGDKPVALVGKGITFDSGGISIKPAPSMEEMKYDMMGAATVAGIVQAVAALGLPININAYIAACENMPSGTAQKPGDIQTSSGGKTVEITNTDAEGRLILADALEYAQKSDPQAIIDFATLTGAVLIALGTISTGIMGTSPELINRLKKSSEATGERVWELPLYEEYEEDLKSAYANYRNSGGREAGSSKGGTFLKFFVDPKFPWVHCDIAGTAWNRKDVNYHPPKNASGAMVRLMIHALENWQTMK